MNPVYDTIYFVSNIELWKALLLVAGLALIIVEMFHPGFGAPGITGGILLVLAICLIANSVTQALILIILSLIFLSIVLAAVVKSAKSGRLSKIIVLDESLDKESGFSATENNEELEGSEGVALSILRPAGSAIIDGKKYDVVTEGDFISASKKIKVIKVEGRRIVVKEI